jgi:predicted DNA-binding transcriptional regulator YafY
VSSAHEQFTRIVSLVAEGTRHENKGGESESIQEIAQRHGVTVKDINRDLRALTQLGNSAEADWLLSLNIFYEADEVSVSSRGPFRRPVRLTPEEQLSIQLALALDPRAQALATRLAPLWTRNGETPQSPKTTHVAPDGVSDMIRYATRARLGVRIEYAGEAEHQVRIRTVNPYQLAELGIRSYLVAWDTEVGAWRHFRLDRIVSCEVTTSLFELRNDFTPMTSPRDAYRPEGATEEVTVRFRKESAPWVTESFPRHQVQPDGSVFVTFETTSVEWMTRRVLEFGADAEVVAPARYRDAVRRAVA